MFCGNCGAENANGAKFCKSCGKPLDNTINSQAGKKRIPQKDSAGAVGKIKALPKNFLIGAGIAIVALIAVICVAVNAGKTINLDKYMTIEATGYDGYGTARAVIDWDAIAEKYGDKISFTGKAASEYGGMLTYITPVEILQDCVNVRLNPANELSNGSEIEYNWDIDEELSAYLKCKIKYTDSTYTVPGLTEVGTFDAFADLEIVFEGIAPNGWASINYNGSELSYYDFTCDKTSGLSNGDTITVTINDNRLEYYAENLGAVPETLEKAYIVEGLESYLTEISEIKDEGLVEMQNQAIDVYNAYVAKNWSAEESLESFTYIGNYLLTPKNTDLWGTHNILYLVYKIQVHDNYSNEGEVYNKLNDIYWYISFDNLMIDANGNLVVDVTRYNTPYTRFTIDSGVMSGWWTKTWSYDGYETLEELYTEVVTAKIDSYKHEDNVDESTAPATVTAREEEEVTAEAGYIFANSDTQLLTKADLEGLSKEECQIARNEIYARHGRRFNDEELQAYFDAQEWYEGTIDPDDFQESVLSDIEIANKNLIVTYEEEKGYR